MKASWAGDPNADPRMSKNAPRPGGPPTSPNSDRACRVNTITRVGILSGSEGERSSPPLTDQLSFPSFWSEEMLSQSKILP
jgi:hypothetical protein